MKILSRDRKPAHFKMDFGVEGGFSADNQDEENNFEIVADLLEESDFQIEKEDDLNNDVSFIYVHKILFIASRCKINFRVVFVRKDFLQTCLECAPSFFGLISWNFQGYIKKRNTFDALYCTALLVQISKESDRIWGSYGQKTT